MRLTAAFGAMSQVWLGMPAAHDDAQVAWRATIRASGQPDHVASHHQPPEVAPQ